MNERDTSGRVNRRNMLLGGAAALGATTQMAQAQQSPAQPAPAQQQRPAQPAAAGQNRQPNILVIWGDDIGVHNVSSYNHGIMGYRTPNIDREGALFTDHYGQQSKSLSGKF